MSAWGKTGRVHVDRSREGDYNDVYIDYAGTKCGNVDQRYRETDWRVVWWDASGNLQESRAASFDAGVMYLLRRVDAKLWREERGEVWRVHSYGGGGHGLHVINPRDNQCQGCYDECDLPRAITRAHREACEAYL